MNQGFIYSLINQISLYAGFNPELSLSTGQSPITIAANSLFVEYHCFPIYREEISTRGDSLPPLRESLPPLGESFPPLGELLPPLRELLPPLRESLPPLRESLPPLRELLPPLGESFPPLRESFPPLAKSFPLRGELFPLKRNGWRMHRKSFLPTHNRSLLQDKAFIAGYKSFIFVRTLFRRRKRIFPIRGELFRKRGATSAFGKNQVG